MSTTFQKAGEICSSCEGRWKLRKRQPKMLVALPNVTMKHKEAVACCPYCDGPVYDIATATARRRDIDAPPAQ